MGQAGEVGRVLGGANVLALSGRGAGTLRVDLGAPGYEPASAWLSLQDGTPASEDVRRVIDALLEGRSVDFTGPHPIARASWRADLAPRIEVGGVAAALVEVEPEHAHGAPRPRNQRIAGWSLFGLGAASIGTSVGLHLWRGELGERFSASPGSLSAAQQWNNARIGVWASAAFGGAATSAAMPLLLPEYPRTPWWGWTLGAVGLGLTGYAIYEGVTMSGCPDPFVADEAAVRSCVARGQEAGRLSLALAGAAPLLSIPLVYLVRPLRVEPSISASRVGAMIRVRKAF
jgi:hypothetical protein